MAQLPSSASTLFNFRPIVSKCGSTVKRRSYLLETRVRGSPTLTPMLPDGPNFCGITSTGMSPKSLSQDEVGAPDPGGIHWGLPPLKVRISTWRCLNFPKSQYCQRQYDKVSVSRPGNTNQRLSQSHQIVEKSRQDQYRLRSLQKCQMQRDGFPRCLHCPARSKVLM